MVSRTTYICVTHKTDIGVTHTTDRMKRIIDLPLKQYWPIEQVINSMHRQRTRKPKLRRQCCHALISYIAFDIFKKMVVQLLIVKNACTIRKYGDQQTSWHSRTLRVCDKYLPSRWWGIPQCCCGKLSLPRRISVAVPPSPDWMHCSGPYSPPSGEQGRRESHTTCLVTCWTTDCELQLTL